MDDNMKYLAVFFTALLVLGAIWLARQPAEVDYGKEDCWTSQGTYAC